MNGFPVCSGPINNMQDRNQTACDLSRQCYIEYRHATRHWCRKNGKTYCFLTTKMQTDAMGYATRALELTEIGWTTIEIGTYIHKNQWDVITNSSPNLNGGWVETTVRLWYGWVITSHINHMCGSYPCSNFIYHYVLVDGSQRNILWIR